MEAQSRVDDINLSPVTAHWLLWSPFWELHHGKCVHIFQNRETPAYSPFNPNFIGEETGPEKGSDLLTFTQ